MDYRWCTSGGILSDGLGDIAFSTPNQELIDMIYTRVKASLEGWQLYNLGADLESQIGALANPTTCSAIQRQIANSLSDILLPSAFQVQTLSTGNTIDAFVLINNTAVLIATVNESTTQVTTL